MQIEQYLAGLAGFGRPPQQTSPIDYPATAVAPDPWNSTRVPSNMDMLHRFAGGQLYSTRAPYTGDVSSYGFGPQHRNYVPDTTGWGTSTATATQSGTATNDGRIDGWGGPDPGEGLSNENAGRGLVGSPRGMMGVLGGLTGLLGGYATRNSFLEALNNATPGVFGQSFNPFGQGSFMGRNGLGIAVDMLLDPHVPEHVQNSIAAALQAEFPGQEAHMGRGWSGAADMGAASGANGSNQTSGVEGDRGFL
jgi:hypothetical protein